MKSSYVVILSILSIFYVVYGKTYATESPPIEASREVSLASAGRDPFVRGLLRLDERLRLEREEIIRLKNLRETIKKDDHHPPPDFARAFAASHYRPAGVFVAAQADNPTIHMVSHQYANQKGIHFWSGKMRRWVYRRGHKETLADIATKFKMRVDDILTLNSVLSEAQLSNPMQIYISPRDNAPLIHIVKRGETLSMLARAYSTQIAHLKMRNQYVEHGNLQIGQRLIIREKTLTHDMIARAMPEPSAATSLMPLRIYARLEGFSSREMAARAADTAWQNYRHFMDADMLIRSEGDAIKPVYYLDIGPMHSPRHAKAWCVLVSKIYDACKPISRVMAKERKNSFASQAVVNITPHVFYDADGVENTMQTNIDAAKRVEYHLFEGQVLGNGTGMITKITPHYIYLASMHGQIYELPFYYVPESDPALMRARRKQEQAARIAQAASLVHGDATGGQAVPSDEILETDIGNRLKQGEQQRRLGSTKALNQVLGTDFN